MLYLLTRLAKKAFPQGQNNENWWEYLLATLMCNEFDAYAVARHGSGSGRKNRLFSWSSVNSSLDLTALNA